MLSTYPTIPNPLAGKASAGLAQGVAPFVAQAKKYKIPLSLTELNSVSCGGKDSVSNTLAVALWGTDVMFNMASIGVKGVNFHTGSDAYYSPFTFKGSDNTRGKFVAKVKPLYYGMLLFAKATGNQARLLPVSSRSKGNVKVWATVDQRNIVRIVAINKDISAKGNARIKLSSPRSPASLVRLLGSTISSSQKITLGGQTFYGTTNGKPVGKYTSTAVTPNQGTTYTFSLPPASAALLTIKP